MSFRRSTPAPGGTRNPYRTRSPAKCRYRQNSISSALNSIGNISHLNRLRIATYTSQQRASTAPPTTLVAQASATPIAENVVYGYNGVQKYGLTTFKAADKFSFIWAIKNFSDARKLADIKSQDFYDEETRNSWKLKLIFKPKDVKKYIKGSIALKIICTRAPALNLETTFEVALLRDNETPFLPTLKRIENKTFATEKCWTIFQFLELADLENDRLKLLNCDILRIQCTLWTKSGEMEYKTVNPESNSQDVCENLEIKHSNTVTKDLEKMRKLRLLTDFQIITSTKVFHVHKVILGARSSVFLAMLSHPMIEHEANSVHLADFEEATIEEMLTFLYTGKFAAGMLEPTVIDLLQLGDKYDIKGLKIEAENFLLGLVTVENAAQLLALSHFHNANKLKDKVRQFFSVHSDEIRKTKAFQGLTQKHPEVALDIFLTTNLEESEKEADI